MSAFIPRRHNVLTGKSTKHLVFSAAKHQQKIRKDGKGAMKKVQGVDSSTGGQTDGFNEEVKPQEQQ